MKRRIFNYMAATFFGLSLAGIAGAILVYRKHPAGRWLALLPAALCMAASFLSFNLDREEVVMWMMLGVFFLIPYFLLRYLLHRNGMDKPFEKYLVGNIYVLPAVALIVQLGDKKYRTKSWEGYGISMVQSMDGTQTVTIYAGENTVAYSVYARLKYELDNGVLTILGTQ